MYPQLGDLRNPVCIHISSERGYIHRVLEKRYFTHSLQIIIPGGLSFPHVLRYFYGVFFKRSNLAFQWLYTVHPREYHTVHLGRELEEVCLNAFFTANLAEREVEAMVAIPNESL